MNFDFSSTAGASQSTIKPVLNGYEIHDVTFKSVFADDFTSKAGKKFNTLKFRFENDRGYFEHVLFEPTEKSAERMVFGENELASGNEQMMLFIKHLLDFANPELAKQIDEGNGPKTPNTWEAFRKFIIEIMTPGFGKTTKLKLTVNKSGNTSLPSFSIVDKTTKQVRLSNNFIGPNLFFSSYEKGLIEKQLNAKSDTNAVKFDLADTTPSSNDDDLDFEL